MIFSLLHSGLLLGRAGDRARPGVAAGKLPHLSHTAVAATRIRRQDGQEECDPSHGSMQATWNACPQWGSTRISSPSANSARQTVQSENRAAESGVKVSLGRERRTFFLRPLLALEGGGGGGGEGCASGEGGGGGEAAEPGAAGDGDEAQDAYKGAEKGGEDDHVVGVDGDGGLGRAGGCGSGSGRRVGGGGAEEAVANHSYMRAKKPLNTPDLILFLRATMSRVVIYFFYFHIERNFKTGQYLTGRMSIASPTG
ncbi:hypothetical protein NL676_025336 [Syzygium grande]|nr:hypothetical protein NL676_025336 [Syzygium grande]